MSSSRPRRSRRRSERDGSLRPSSRRRPRCRERLPRGSEGRSRHVSSASVSAERRSRHSSGRSSSTRSVSTNGESVRRSLRGRPDRSSGCCPCDSGCSRHTESLSPRSSGLSRCADRCSQCSRSLRRHFGRTSAPHESRCRKAARRRQGSRRKQGPTLKSAMNDRRPEMRYEPPSARVGSSTTRRRIDRRPRCDGARS